MTLAKLYICEENFDHFPLFDETLRHKELCISVISLKVLNKMLELEFQDPSDHCYKAQHIKIRVLSNRI